MPHHLFTLTETEQSILRPVVIDVVSDLKRITSIPDKVDIFFPGDIQAMQNPSSGLDNQNNRFPIFNNTRRLFIEVQEVVNENAIAVMDPLRDDANPVFDDGKLGVRISPVYKSTQLRISVRYNTVSKTEAVRWRQDMMMRLSALRSSNIHDLTYHYPLHPWIMEAVKEIWTKREALAGYGDSYAGYVQKHSDSRLQVASDLIGDELQLIIKERQIDVSGRYEFQTEPEQGQRENDQATWVISFSYLLDFDKPIGLLFAYPVIVHNQVLDKKYVDFKPAYDYGAEVKRFGRSAYALDGFDQRTMMGNLRKEDPVIRLPRYDDFILTEAIPGTATVAIVLTEFAPDKRFIFNLKDMGDFVFDPDVLNFIENGEWPFVTKRYCSVINFCLYRETHLCSTESLTMDSQLSLSTTYNVDYRRQHRVRLSLNVDWTTLTNAAMERLCAHPKALAKILKAMDEALAAHPDFDRVGERSSITTYEWSRLYQYMTGFSFPPSNATLAYNSTKEGLFKDILPSEVEYHRQNRKSMKTVVNNSVATYRR